MDLNVTHFEYFVHFSDSASYDFTILTDIFNIRVVFVVHWWVYTLTIIGKVLNKVS